MRTRFVTLLSLGVLAAVAVSARADFRVVTGVDAGPMDVWIRDAGISSPGVFSVHNGNSAFLVIDDPGGAASVVSRFACIGCRGTWISGDGGIACLNAIRSSGGTWRDCTGATAGTFPPVDTSAVQRSRATEALSVYADGTNSSFSNQSWYGPRTTPSQPWFQTIGGSGTDPAAVAAVSRGPDDYGLLLHGVAVDTLLAKNNTPEPFSAFRFTGGVPSWADLQVLPNGFLRAMGTGDIGAQVITYNLDAGTFTALNVPQLGATPHRLGAVALREGMGNQYGDGVGFLLVTSSTYPNVYRAIPDPTAPGMWWAPSSVAPPGLSTGAVYDVVRCIDSTYCVLASTTSATTTVVTYRNTNLPWVESPAFEIDEGATAVPLRLGADDLDGDAVFITLEPEAGSDLYLSAVTREPADHDGRAWNITAKAANTDLCAVASHDVRVEVVVSDGLASHVQRDAGYIRVRRTSVPTVVSGGPFLVPAGSPSNTYDLSYQAPLCGVTSVDSGTIVQQAPPLQRSVALIPATNMVRVTFQPPRVWCSADAGIDTYDLTLSDLAMSSDAGTVSFLVLPWGEPEVPFAPGRVEVQDAGTTVTYATDATHLCAGAGGFPGTDTSWTWTWSPDDAGFSSPVIRRSDGSDLPPSGGVTPTATVVAPDCVSGVITFQASNTTRGTGGMSSAVADLTVDVLTRLKLLSTGSAILTAGAGADGGVVGQVDLSPDLNCPGLRAATADLTLFRDDGGVVSSIPKAPVPGPYLLPAPNACGGGQFLVEAIVSDATGALAPIQQPVQLPLLPPGLSGASVPDFVISCGDAGYARATATIGPGQCPSAQISWSSSGAVAITPATGEAVDLFTASADFGGLIGMPVDLTATATSETGSASLSAQSRVIALPFVSVTHRTDTPVASEARVLGVEVTLTNTTACDVSGIEWHESLRGMRWVEGSAQVGDAGVGAVLDGGELVVPGLSLPAGQSLTLRYSARPTLFGDPSPGGVAVLRSVPISTGGGLATGQGTCGCQSAAGAWPALLGLAAAALLRRRRSGALKFRS